MGLSLSTWAIPIASAFAQAAGHASQKTGKVRHGFPGLWDTIRGQDLRRPALVLRDAQATPGIQISHLAHGQITPEARPHRFNGVEIAAVGWKLDGGHAILPVYAGLVQESFIVVPYIGCTL